MKKLEYCYEATLIQIVIEQSSILKALQIIAKNLNKEELFQVLEWAPKQIRAISKRFNPDKMYADKYLCPDFPSLNIPLVLSMKVKRS